MTLLNSFGDRRGMHRRQNLCGKRFGRFVVKKFAASKNGCAYWVCQCDCGGSKSVSAKNLRSGNVRSCGCLLFKRSGKSRTTEYYSWRGLISRCTKQNDPAFDRYGGRGIYVDKRWLDFNTFISDMGPCPTGYSLDRINNDGPYSPENCRWASQKTQCNNRRNNHVVTFNKKRLTLAQWQQVTGLSQVLIGHRLAAGWSIKRALTQPLRGT